MLIWNSTCVKLNSWAGYKAEWQSACLSWMRLWVHPLVSGGASSKHTGEGGREGGRRGEGGRQDKKREKQQKKNPLFKKDIFNILFAWICVGICACISSGAHRGQKRCWIPWTGSCEQLDMGARNRTWILYKVPTLNHGAISTGP